MTHKNTAIRSIPFIRNAFRPSIHRSPENLRGQGLGPIPLILVAILLATFFTLPAFAYDPALACQEWSWVGVKVDPDGDCPDPGGDWAVRHLFDDGTLPTPGGLPLLLKPFCYYEHPGAGDPADIQTLSMLSSTSSSCLNVAPAGSGDTLSDITWPLLRRRFVESAEVGEMPLTDATPPRLALLDTVATRESGVADNPGNSLHGYTLANMAEELLCTAGDCPVQMTSRLALPYLSYDPTSGTFSERDDLNGGYLGSLADLALALWSEAHRWNRGGGLAGQRLVMNLSLGWNGEAFGGLDGEVFEMPAAVQGVYRALEYASCHGALVVAAAGNHAGGPSAGNGPLLPAAWEARAAPDFAACVDLLGFTPDPKNVPFESDPATYRPLVHAVGGVDGLGQPLANARPGGMPRLTAHGRHGVVEGHLAGQPTATLTGSSVATLLTSSAAAAVWYYAPELMAHEVMQRLWESADALAFEADFYFENGEGVPGARQISVCQAIEATCPEGSGCMGLSPGCVAVLPGVSSLDFSGFVASAQQVEDGSGVDDLYAESTKDCNGERLIFDEVVGLPVYLCPHHQLDGAALEPWVSTQPGSTPCPNCTFDDGDRSMMIEIAPDYQGTLSNPILIVDTTLYSLDVQPMVAGDTALVENLDYVVIAPGDEEKVSISFTVTGGGLLPASDTSPVLVVP